MTSLRTVRRRKLLSQRDLADKAGITTSTIYLTEAGKSTPRLQVMRKLSDALQVDPMEVDEFRKAIEGAEDQALN